MGDKPAEMVAWLWPHRITVAGKSEDLGYVVVWFPVGVTPVSKLFVRSPEHDLVKK